MNINEMNGKVPENTHLSYKISGQKHVKWKEN